MGEWIKASEASGRESRRTAEARDIAKDHARDALMREYVDEPAVEAFLDPIKLSMVQVKAELEAQGYTVKDEGYKFVKIFYQDQEKYALVNKGHHPEAYAQTWVITMPTGEQLDTLHLFPYVGESTHFSQGSYELQRGGQRFVDPADDIGTAVGTVQDLIGARIKDFFEKGR